MRIPKRLHTLILLGLLTPLAGPALSAPALLLASGVRAPHSTPAQSGFVDRLASEAFRRLGRDIEIVQLPAQRALEEANAGIVDGDLLRVAEITEAFPHLRRVPEKLLDFDFMAFTRRHPFTPAGWRSLAPYAVGIVAGWKILERNLRETHSLATAEDTRQLMRLLANDRIDVAVSERWQGLQAIQDLRLDDVRQLEPPVKSREMFLMLHERHADLVPRLAEALRAMRRDGTYARLFDETLRGLQPHP